LDRWAQEFSEENPYGVTVLSEYKNPYLDAVDQSLLVGEPPDLALALNHQAAGWSALGFRLADLAPYVQDADYGLAVDEQFDYIEPFSAQGVYSTTRLSFPFYREAHLIFYNTSWAQELGFASPPVTMVEFQVQSCAAAQANLRDEAADNDGTGGWLVRSDYRPSLAWIYALGGQILDGNIYDYQSDAASKTFDFLFDLAQEGCSWFATESSPSSAFANREALFISESSGMIAGLLQAQANAERADQWQVLRYQDEDEGHAVVLAEGPDFVIFSTTPARELAGWLFIKWLTAPERQAAWSRETGTFPVRTSALGQLAAERQFQPQWQQLALWLPLARVDPGHAAWDQLRWVLSDANDELYRFGFDSDQIPPLLLTLTNLSGELNPFR
jgi:ABC-type glycerol-3-phosphate transport system substrate-binding protein